VTADDIKHDFSRRDYRPPGKVKKIGKKKEGFDYGGIADAANQYLRVEEEPESDSGKAAEHGRHGGQPIPGGR
jgi:hypothetical protein